MKNLKSIILSLIGLTLLLFILEIGMRFADFKVLEINEEYFHAEPKDCYTPKNGVGVGLVPGKFQITINGVLKYTATHTEDSMRTSGFRYADTLLPLVEFYGCSFTYGMSVNDHENYPFLLQRTFPELEIHNRAVSGHSQIQLLNRLLRQPEEFKNTKCLVLNYLSFHDERNTLNPNFQQKVNIGFQIREKEYDLLDDFYFPKASLKEGHLSLDKMHIREIKKSLFLEQNSVLIHALKTALRNMSVDEEMDFEVSKSLVKAIAIKAEEMGIPFVLTVMSNDSRGKQMMSYAQQLNIEVLDISVDFSDPVMTNQPYDPHPSAKAHQIFADKLKPLMQRFSLATAVAKSDL